MLKSFLIEDVARSAYRHGQGYRDANIYRSTGRYHFKHPEAVGLPDWVLMLSIEDHAFLAALYKKAFRSGLNSTKTKG